MKYCETSKFIVTYKMGKQIITFAEIVVENMNFIVTKDLLFNDVNINKIIVSKKVPFRKKHFFFGPENHKTFLFSVQNKLLYCHLLLHKEKCKPA